MEQYPQDEDVEEFRTVRVFGRLITKDDPNFDRLFGSQVDKVPVRKDEIVLPVFDLVFDDFDEPPMHSTKDMIRKEIDEIVVKNREIAKVIQGVKPEQVVKMPPIGQPKTRSVEVGKIAVTPEGTGLISTFFFDELGETVDTDF